MVSVVFPKQCARGDNSLTKCSQFKWRWRINEIILTTHQCEVVPGDLANIYPTSNVTKKYLDSREAVSVGRWQGIQIESGRGKTPGKCEEKNVFFKWVH